MPLVANGSYLYNGKGAVLLKRLEAGGTAQGFKLVGSATKCAIQMGAEVHDERSPMEAGAPITRRFVSKTTPELQLTIKEYDADVLALALLGTRLGYTQTATPITNEVINDVKQGHYVELAKLGPISAVTVEPAGGGTAYVLDTDYRIENGVVPLIYIIPGGGIADAADIQVDYTPTAYSTALKQIRGGIAPTIECAMRFRPDPTAGPKEYLQIWKVGISSDALIDLIHHDTAEPGSFDLKGAVLSDAANHPNEPYFLFTELGTV